MGCGVGGLRKMNIKDEYPDLLVANGFDEAIMGVAARIGLEAICYDKNKVIEILMREMTEEEAIEYFEYNMLNVWVGESTPIFLETI